MNKLLLFSSIFLFNACMPDEPNNESQISTTDTAQSLKDTTINKAAERYQLVTDASTLIWRGERITGEGHKGTVDISSGFLNITDDNIIAGEITLDMTSMRELNSESEETSQIVIGYLHSQRFFDTEKYPKAYLSIKGENQGILLGDLKIKGISKEVQFPINKVLRGDTLQAKGNFSIDRTKWGLTYRSAKNIQDLAEFVIKDSIYFKTNITAVRK